MQFKIPDFEAEFRIFSASDVVGEITVFVELLSKNRMYCPTSGGVLSPEWQCQTIDTPLAYSKS